MYYKKEWGLKMFIQRSSVAFALGILAGTPVHAVDFRDKENWCSQIAAFDGAIGSTTALVALADEPDTSPIRLSPIVAQVPEGGTVAAILERERFLPDETNLSLVRYLNPQISDIGKIQPNQQVFLPSLEKFDGNSWQAYIPDRPIDGFLVEQRLVPRLTDSVKMEATDIRAELQALVAENKLPSETSGGIISDYDNAYNIIANAEWKKFAGSVDETDRYLVYAEQNNEIAKSFIKASRSSEIMSDSVVSAFRSLQTASSERSTARGTVSVVINTEAGDGTKINQLTVKYMSHGAIMLDCDRKHGRPFATQSYEARQVMRRAKWYVWAEDFQGKSVISPFELDLTLVSDKEYIRKIMVEIE